MKRVDTIGRCVVSRAFHQSKNQLKRLSTAKVNDDRVVVTCCCVSLLLSFFFFIPRCFSKSSLILGELLFFCSRALIFVFLVQSQRSFLFYKLVYKTKRSALIGLKLPSTPPQSLILLLLLLPSTLYYTISFSFTLQIIHHPYGVWVIIVWKKLFKTM